MGYSISNNIFNVDYQPLPFDLLRELLTYISVIYDFMKINDYCVSCSVSEGRYIFWDIQTPDGKIIRYGV